jgi:hypothetical protein
VASAGEPDRVDEVRAVQRMTGIAVEDDHLVRSSWIGSAPTNDAAFFIAPRLDAAPLCQSEHGALGYSARVIDHRRLAGEERQHQEQVAQEQRNRQTQERSFHELIRGCCFTPCKSRTAFAFEPMAK